MSHEKIVYDISLPIQAEPLAAYLTVPRDREIKGLVLFVHGSGSSRHSPRNQYVANRLSDMSYASLLADLLTVNEELDDRWSARFRFDIKFLAKRVAKIIQYVSHKSQDEGANPPWKEIRGLPMILFGASTGAAAAVEAHGLLDERNMPREETKRSLVKAIISRGGRPDLASKKSYELLQTCPLLLIVGAADSPQVIKWNKDVAKEFGGPGGNSSIEVNMIDGATHLFEEPGKLDEVVDHVLAFLDGLFGK